MIFRPCDDLETGCAAHLFGCGGLGKRAVVVRITHVIDTRVHADHRPGGRALAAVPPKPVEMERRLRFNPGRPQPLP